MEPIDEVYWRNEVKGGRKLNEIQRRPVRALYEAYIMVKVGGNEKHVGLKHAKTGKSR